jgi:hypothetical protein
LLIIQEDFAAGTHARVSLVRGPDHVLLVWKRPNDRSKRHQHAFAKAIERSTLWRALGLSTAEVWWHHDGCSLLGTYVPGATAFERIQSASFWTDRKYEWERRGLARFFEAAARQRAYIRNLSPTNLIFDGTRWQLIDSGSIRFRESPETVLRKYRKVLLAVWAPKMNPAGHTGLRDFLERLTLQGVSL